jgi:hypothetical protein
MALVRAGLPIPPMPETGLAMARIRDGLAVRARDLVEDGDLREGWRKMAAQWQHLPLGRELWRRCALAEALAQGRTGEATRLDDPDLIGASPDPDGRLRLLLVPRTHWRPVPLPGGGSWSWLWNGMPGERTVVLEGWTAVIVDGAFVRWARGGTDPLAGIRPGLYRVALVPF